MKNKHTHFIFLHAIEELFFIKFFKQKLFLTQYGHCGEFAIKNFLLEEPHKIGIGACGWCCQSTV